MKWAFNLIYGQVFSIIKIIVRVSTNIGNVVASQMDLSNMNRWIEGRQHQVDESSLVKQKHHDDMDASSSIGTFDPKGGAKMSYG